MKYILTEQYSRGTEKPTAAFIDLNDTHFFIEKRVSGDEKERKCVIYRIYEDSELLLDVNKTNLSVSYAQYADGGCDVSTALPSTFKIMFKRCDQSEKLCLASFNDKNDALLFILSKCELDGSIHDNDLFFILKHQYVIDTFNKTTIHHHDINSGRSSGKSTFQPTPLQTRPTPPGTPRDCWVEHDEDDTN